MAKMIDVAKRAGVSLKTVSRVLNNEPHVQTSVRERVRVAVSDLGYIPSASARSLRSSRTYVIHLISHSTRSNFANTIQFSALQSCQGAGYRMEVSMLDRAEATSQKKLQAWFDGLFSSGKPDGVILVPPLSNDEAIGKILDAAEIPVVRIGPNEIKDGNSTVLIDDRAAAKEAVDYLIGLGHERIGFIRGKEDQDATHERYKGYRDALAAADLEFNQALEKPGLFDFQSGLTSGSELLSLPKAERPTAIFACHDDMAAGVLVAAHGLGSVVPDDLSVFGFDDSEIAEKMWPALTTIRQPLQQYGSVAMDILTAIAGRKQVIEQETHTLPYLLVPRQSTGPA